MKLNYKRTRNNSQFLYDLGNVYSTSDLINRLVNVDAIANVKSDAKSKETEGETEDVNKAAFECTKLIVNGQVLYDLSVLKPIHDDLVNAAADLKSGEASDEEREEARVRFDAIDGYNKIFKSFARKLSQLPQELNHLPNEFVEITADGFNQSVEIKLNLEDYRQMLKNDAVAYQLSFKSASDRALVVAKLDDFADYEAKLAELIDDDIWQKMNPVKRDSVKHLQEQLNDLLKAEPIEGTESTDNAEDAPKENADVKPSNGEAGAENAQTDNSGDAQVGNESSTNDVENTQSDSEKKSPTDNAEDAPKENADVKPSNGEAGSENAQTDNSEDAQTGSKSSTNGEETAQSDDKDNSSTNDAENTQSDDKDNSTTNGEETVQSDGKEKSSTNDAQDVPKSDEKSSDGENDNAETAQSDGNESSTDDAQDTPKQSADEKPEDNLTKRLDEIEAKLSAPKTDDIANTLAQVIMAFMKNNPAVKPVDPAPKVPISSFEAQDAALASDPSWMSGLLDED